MSGFLKAQRNRFDHHLFVKEKFCRGYAWDWLVAQAAWKNVIVDVSGKSIHLKRGQLCHSIRFIATKWNWSKSAVDRFLTRLKNETMIETVAGTGCLIITICNYDKYQGSTAGTGQKADQSPGQKRDRSGTKIKKDKKIEEDIAAILAECCSPQVALDFIEYRRELNAPLTPHAAKIMVAKLGEHPNPDDVFNLSIQNGWKGIFPENVGTKLRVVGETEQFGAFGRIPLRG
ncbi:hypothetical protein [Ruegeria sp. HKCCA4008]|uniref:hypothetical protein n=1 Tax=Ruegeria sp. HKCCA4008 TaxID=2682999 RepID=UPI001489CAD9|nr:hypothetical protein [Ruegeria sp. HKCCA4008]